MAESVETGAVITEEQASRLKQELAPIFDEESSTMGHGIGDKE